MQQAMQTLQSRGLGFNMGGMGGPGVGGMGGGAGGFGGLDFSSLLNPGAAGAGAGATAGAGAGVSPAAPSPAITFATQLQALRDMGFSDDSARYASFAFLKDQERGGVDLPGYASHRLVHARQTPPSPLTQTPHPHAQPTCVAGDARQRTRGSGTVARGAVVRDAERGGGGGDVTPLAAPDAAASAASERR